MLISEVIQNIKNYCKGEWYGKKIEEATTRDKILYGDPDKECTGIVTTIYASIDVIKKAHELGANLIIAHEALLWNRGDHREWLEESNNQTYLAKKKLMDDYGIVVWRFHDYIHSGIPHNDGYSMVWLSLLAGLLPRYTMDHLVLYILNVIRQHLQKLVKRS